MTTSPPHIAERARFKALILANPNHFGNLKNSPLKAALSIVGNTTYEQLGCVGYQSQRGRLEGIITIKQAQGYSGSICSPGSLEYVRFYTSADGGTTWVDQGLTSVNVHDLGGSPGDVQYAVSLQIDPVERLCVSGANLPLLRAILQWNAPPPAGRPDHVPPWGNVVDTQIQIESVRSMPLAELVKLAKFSKAAQPLIDALDLQQTVTAAPKALSAAALHAQYQGAVPPHRFALAELHALAKKPSFLSGSTAVAHAIGMAIDPAHIAAALAPSAGNTTFEQLNCVGFNPTANLLEAVVHVKNPSGYSGDLCSAGSREYVAFWADSLGDGTFATYLGTASVRVYDINTLPVGGLDYAVFLPVDLSRFQKPCSQGPALLNIRATLSWQVPPTTSATFVPTWGNTVQARIQVTPGPVVGTNITPVITAVGDTPVTSINQISGDPNIGLATGTTIMTGMGLSSSPFGGTITIAGKILNGTSATRYRLMAKRHSDPDTAYAQLTDEPGGLGLVVLNLSTLTDVSITAHADSSGYYTYQDSANLVIDSLLMRWFSTTVADGGPYALRIDVSVDGNPANDLHSNAVTVVVDNTPPVVELTVDTPAGLQCPDVLPGGTITGTFSATDVHFGGIDFTILPSLAPTSTPPGGFVITSSPSTPAANGYVSGTYSIATNAMPPCGYSLTLGCSDRTNVDSGRGSHRANDSIGFCIMPIGTVLG